MPLRDGVRRKPMIVVMTGKRILKPTGWVVDMRRYLDAAESSSSPLSRRDHRGTGPHVWIHRLAVSAVRGQRMDPWMENTPWDRHHDAGAAPASGSPTTTH
jgi:hypothetical protein